MKVKGKWPTLEAWGIMLNLAWAYAMFGMFLLCVLTLAQDGFNALYLQGSHPVLENFGFRVRTLMLYCILAYYASTRIQGFRGIPVSLSCILVQHATYEALQHTILYNVIIYRAGQSAWMKDMALYAFMLSTFVYVLQEVDLERLRSSRRIQLVIVSGILLFIIPFSMIVVKWWPWIIGQAEPFLITENLPLEELPKKVRLEVLLIRVQHFLLKYGLAQATAGLVMAFRRDPP